MGFDPFVTMVAEVRHRLGECGPRQRQAVRQAVAVLGEEGGTLGGVENPFAGTERAGHLLVEADVRLDRADAVIGEQHDVGMLLQQRRGAGVQLDDVAVEGLVLGAVEALDVGVRDLDDRHAALVAQRVQALEVLAPQIEGGDIALAVARLLQVLPAVLLTRLLPDQRLEPVDRVDDHGLERRGFRCRGRRAPP